MVNKVKNFFKREIRGLHEAAYLLAAFSVLSQIFALIRDRLFASYFGTGLELDIYFAAFKLPDLMFVIISALVSVSVLVPQFVRFIESKKELKETLDSIFTVLIVFSIILLFLAFIFTEKFLYLIVPDLLSSGLGEEMILITRILLIQPIILSLSSLMGSLVQAYKKFTVYALSPVLYNFGIILGVVFFYPIFGLIGLAYGVIVGALLHLIMQSMFIFEEGIYPKLTTKIRFKKVYYIVVNSFPRTAAILSTQAILIYMTYLASTMVYGSISTFNLSYNLQAVPLAIIGVSYSLAAFPALSKFFQDGEMQKFYKNINQTLRHILFWSLPIMAMFIVLRAQIVRVILGSGNFDWEATRLVAAALAIFTLSIWSQSISILFLRAYYAMGKTLKPFLITFSFFILVVMSSFYFLDLVNSDKVLYIKEFLRLNNVSDISVLALPVSFSFAQIIYTILLILFFGNFTKIINKRLLHSVWQSFIASLTAFLVTFISLNFWDRFFDLNTFWGILSQGFISGVTGLVSAFAILILIGNREVKTVIKTVKTKFWKTKPISPEVEEEL